MDVDLSTETAPAQGGVAAALRRGWWLVLGCALLAGLVVHGMSDARDRTYASTARLVLAPAALEEPGDIVDTSGALDAGPIVTTFAEVMSGSAVADAAQQQAPLREVDIADYSIEAAPRLTANVVELTVEGPDPEGARDVATAVSIAATAYFEELYPVYLVDQLDAPAVEPGAVAPQPGRDAALALLAGALVGVVVALGVWGRRSASLPSTRELLVPRLGGGSPSRDLRPPVLAAAPHEPVR